ncbi:MAG TPA: hypothetical protein VJB90_05870 [Candidatus Nanoarchaeia archaeon]|nr:hypothetical protein [Candidatus Nanoarchaeia archaeon]
MVFGGRGIIIVILLIVLPIAIAQNTTLNQTNQSISLSSKAISSVELKALSQNCVNTYECRELSPGQHYYGCTYDAKTKNCRCFAGDISLCKNPDIKCAFEYECLESTSAEGYNYDCTYNKDTKQCQCFSGNFSLCRTEISNKRKVVEPSKEQNVSAPEPAPVNETAQEQVAPVPPAVTAVAIFFAIALIIIVVLTYALNRPTYDNLMRKARNAHKNAEHAHEIGKEEDAKEYFASAEKYRKNALRLKKRQK